MNESSTRSIGPHMRYLTLAFPQWPRQQWVPAFPHGCTVKSKMKPRCQSVSDADTSGYPACQHNLLVDEKDLHVEKEDGKV